MFSGFRSLLKILREDVMQKIMLNLNWCCPNVRHVRTAYASSYSDKCTMGERKGGRGEGYVGFHEAGHGMLPYPLVVGATTACLSQLGSPWSAIGMFRSFMRGVSVAALDQSGD